MALQDWLKEEIQKAVHEGRPMHQPTPEKQAYYNLYKSNVSQQIIERAKSGGVIHNPSAWKTNLFNKTVNSINAGGSNIGQQGGSTPQYNYQEGTGGSGAPYIPILDQTKPDIIDNTNNQPTTPIGTGAGNSTNRLELNSLVAVAIGFVFVRGAFKLLTKLF